MDKALEVFLKERPSKYRDVSHRSYPPVSFYFLFDKSCFIDAKVAKAFSLTLAPYFI